MIDVSDIWTMNFSDYMILLKRGTRIALRNKVNDSLITGIRLVDSCLPIGRGQRQLILGDKSTGKTSIFVFSLLTSWRYSIISSFEGISTKRLFGLYLGININLSKLMKLLYSVVSYSSFSNTESKQFASLNDGSPSAIVLSNSLSISNYSSVLFLVVSTHSSSSALLSFMIINLGITVGERLRDRGFDSLICFDDLSKHAKCYRQVSLLLGRVPSRDAYSSDVFNIHSSLLERSGRLRLNYFGSSITAFPVIETINSDITEFIATNVISITDGQLYMNKRLFLDSIRPAIDSALSVSRIGSNAQCKFVKVVSAGLKNELTSLRIAFSSFGSQSSSSLIKLSSLNSLFSQSHLIPSFIEFTILLLLCYRLGYYFSDLSSLISFIHFITFYNLSFIYLIFLISSFYSNQSYSFLTSYLSLIA
jgi:F-type H+-transporting ATPase subunit alpha